MSTNIIKKSLLTIAVALSFTTAFAIAPQNTKQRTQQNQNPQNNRTKTISQSNLPQKSQKTITNYFPSNEVRSVKQKSSNDNNGYEVKFKGGTSVSFDKNGDWNKVNTSAKTTVPSDMVPDKIDNYISQKYSNQKIKKFEKRKDGGYNVTLANGVALVFNALYAFVSASK